METTVATLLLLTSTVIIGCLVVSYAVDIVVQTLNTDNIPQIDRLRDLQNSLLNQTETFLYNQTAAGLPSSIYGEDTSP